MNIYYAKTALYAYANLLTISEQIDDLVEKKALASMRDFTPAIEQCEKIVNLTYQKDCLFALKLYLDEVLSKLSKEQLDCLEYKYFKRKPKEYFDGFDFESRAYFRRQKKLAEKIALSLDKLGATNAWFEENCLSMDFFKELLKRTIEHENNYCNKSKRRKPKVINNTMRKCLSA